MLWKHFKLVHLRLNDALKGISDENMDCVMTKGIGRKFVILPLRKKAMLSLNPHRKRI